MNAVLKGQMKPSVTFYHTVGSLRRIYQGTKALRRILDSMNLSALTQTLTF